MTKKSDPNERTDKSSKNISNQWRDRQSIRCRVQNTGNQDAHRNGYDHKIDEQVKAMKRARTQNTQGTNSEGKETGTQINELK